MADVGEAPRSRRRLVVDLRAGARTWSIPDEAVDALRASAPPGWDTYVVAAPTISDGDGNDAPSPEVMREIVDADAYVGFGMPRALFLAGSRLRWIHTAAAGVGSLLFRELIESDVVLTNSAGVHAVPMAEHVLGGILFILRQFDIAVDQQRQRLWNRDPFIGEATRIRELGDCRAVIIGTGGIGTEIARRLSALGVYCTGLRRRPERGRPEGFTDVFGVDALDSVLRSADILIIAAPATGETRGLVTADRLDHLPQGAIVVNVARGSLLDEHAVAERLRDGRLGGAVLDVFEREPLPTDSVLWTTPRLLLTPHVSATSPRGYWRRELKLFTDNWARFAAGRPLRNVVDKSAGY
ncbi:MAG TPA: D-2-hydroxyacid dehydrogenase [Gemmatimonadaceae bacterium]|nr:D-2-hydroxyacid dehydrogenase [Gemmatimonadaceae bacterium]